MKIAGIIAEYNPFHLGHAYHIQATRAHCDAVVVCMTGSYTQRGEAACLSKWERARMALTCGADAVFELPTLFAVRTADAFAHGGVEILARLGVDLLSFGSETDDPELLGRLAALRDREPEAMIERIQQNLNAGMSHARAWGAAAAEMLNVDAQILNAPNVILGTEYLRALKDYSAKPLIIRRRGGYRDERPESGTFASATAVRGALRAGRMEDVRAWTPEAVHPILEKAPEMHEPDDLLLARLRGMTEEEAAELPDVGEGLEKRVLREALQASGREDLIARVKCRRYTYARLSRLTAHALLGMDRSLLSRCPAPEYARLIGMREDARPLLSELKRRTAIPIVSDPAKLTESECFRLECRATDLRALQCSRPEDRRAGQERTQKFVCV